MSRPHASGQLEWLIPYEPGELLALAAKDGRVIARKVVAAAGAPGSIRLDPDRASMHEKTVGGKANVQIWRLVSQPR